MRSWIAATTVLLVATASCAPDRPLAPPRYPSPRLIVESQDGIRRLGKSFLREREGIREARFVGGPYLRGYARGRLAYPEIVHAERDLNEMLDRFVPSSFKRMILQRVVALNLRASIPEIPAEHLEEIVGLSDALFPDPFPEGWSPFARQLAMHALHDFSQRYIGETPVASACTAFVASGRSTADGHTLMARNFDFEAGELFDREKIVAYIIPKDGIPYLSVTFASLTGVTSGFNREGIGIFVNAWSAGKTASAGEPATLLASDVLERARTLPEAIGILEKAPVFVSDLYIVADGKTGQMAVVEKTPARTSVRVGSDLLFAANQPESPQFGGAKLAATSTSAARRRRIEELVRPLRGRLDPLAAVRVLRDRRGIGGKDLGPGNRNAINALISSHSVVFDLTSRKAWVAAAPHGLGRFVAYSLDTGLAADPSDERFTRLSSEAMPPDPWLAQGGYQNYEEARQLLAVGRRALSRKRPYEALSRAREALAIAPGMVEALALTGEALAAEGDLAGARQAILAALDRDPAPPPFARSLKAFYVLLEAGRQPTRRLMYPVVVTDGLKTGRDLRLNVDSADRAP